MIKKYKNIAAAALALSLLFNTTFNTAYAKYYTDRNLPQISQGEIIYRAVDISDLSMYSVKIAELVKTRGNENKLSELLYDSFELYYDTYDAYAVATLMSDREWNERNINNLNEASENYISAVTLIEEMEMTVYNSDYKYLIDDFIDSDDWDMSLNQEITELSAKEIELVNQYNEVGQSSDDRADLFLKLVEVRREIAHKYGYDSYADYADEMIYGRDYSDVEIERVFDNTAEYIVPLCYDFGRVLDEMEHTPVSMTEDEALSAVGTIVGLINPELYDNFNYMTENSLCDTGFSETKSQSGAYTIVLPRLSVPYIFLNPMMDYTVDSASDVDTLIHEFGHFSSMLNSSVSEIPYYDLFAYKNFEVSETHSTGLEVLSEKYYGRVFGASAMYERYMLIYTILAAIIDGCIVTEWERAVYASESLTVDELNHIVADIIAKYYGVICHDEDAEEIWTNIVHVYRSPMYYFSYSLAGMAALQIYDMSLADFDSAVDKYMRISAEGEYASFRKICAKYDIAYAPDGKTIYEMTENIRNTFALGYSDIDKNAWYIPYLYEVSNIISDGDNLFKGDDAVTRFEFVSKIGRMYDYYVGIDKDYTHSFSDVEQHDTNSKYIAWAAEKGIVEGYTDEVFGADDNITREQAATVIYRLANNDNTERLNEAEDFSMFSDGDDISVWAVASVMWAVYNSIIDGRDNGQFDPKANISHAETAKILSCFIKSEY